jgi:hypothetical protein
MPSRRRGATQAIEATLSRLWDDIGVFGADQVRDESPRLVAAGVEASDRQVWVPPPGASYRLLQCEAAGDLLLGFLIDG